MSGAPDVALKAFTAPWAAESAASTSATDTTPFNPGPKVGGIRTAAGSGRPPQGGGIPEKFNDNYYGTDPDDLRREMEDDSRDWEHIDHLIGGGMSREEAIEAERVKRHYGGFDFGRGPADHGGAGPDGGPTNPPEYYEDEPDEDEEEFFDPHHGDPERYIPEGDVADGPLSPHYPHVSDADIAEYEEYLDRHNYHEGGVDAGGQLGTTASRHYANDDVRNDLLQAQGDEVHTIGEYQGFLDDAKAAGDDEAASVLSESISDEHDHAKNFADALSREAYYRYR